MNRAAESSTLRQPLHHSWVAKIFQTMQGNYGTRFLNQWKTGQQFEAGPHKGEDVGIRNAMKFWGEKLSGFAEQPERIARALESLPNDPPNLPAFVELCRVAPSNSKPALEHRQTVEERERAAELSKRAMDAVKKPSYDGLLWAKKPKSQIAMNMVADAKKHSNRFPALAKVFDQLVIDGVCDELGKLISRWDGLAWVKA